MDIFGLGFHRDDAHALAWVILSVRTRGKGAFSLYVRWEAGREERDQDQS